MRGLWVALALPFTAFAVAWVVAATWQAFVDGAPTAGHGPAGAEALQLTNPPPLLLGLDIERRPIEFRINLVPDVGAYEYWLPFSPADVADVDFNRVIDTTDMAWCLLCWRGPEVSYSDTIRETETQELIPVSCWLCDYDDDGDVDVEDFAVFQRLFTGPR